MRQIDDANAFSEAKIAEIRSKLCDIIPLDQLVITCGSYARREASSSSDMDYYAVTDENQAIDSCQWAEELKKIIEGTVGKLPAEQGAFAANIKREELLKNYGGLSDDNHTITRRMLYLLEAEYLTAESKFHEIRTEIIKRYVDNTPGDHQVAFYLLNDIVRYWRTMAVDYADKTYGAANPKPWAIRNIKLIFSRKLIYASGIFSVALTADRIKDEKLTILDKLFRMTPIDRIKYVCGEAESHRLFEMYAYFLEKIADPNVRDGLNRLKNEDRNSDETFRNLKNEGHYFSRELMSLFARTFHASHPIHMAVMF